MKVFESSEGSVWKYVFDTEFEGAITEAVLYRYGSFEERTVLCISVQSGCPVGCTFCGTGNKFIRNLNAAEIVDQVRRVFQDNGIDEDINSRCAKLQIMFMSMGEPFMNYMNVDAAIQILHTHYPDADLLVSTIAPNAVWRYGHAFIELSKQIPKIGLQFSIHSSHDAGRNFIIPYKDKLDLSDLRNYGVEWWHQTGRKPYINFCVTKTFNYMDRFRLREMFPANVFCLTLSVLCSADENMKDAGYRNLEAIREHEQWFQQRGYDTRIFDPAGQDDIGGGCGQLWYVQQYMKDKADV